MIRRKIALFAAICILLGNIEVSASVLGTLTDSWYSELGAETNFYSNTYTDTTVGSQKEFFVEYKPNTNAVPVVVNGESIYGKRTITQAVQYMNKNNLMPLAGINGDYFSLKTGIPMGHTIIDGEIVTKDGTGQNAVGFRADGTGFISWLQIVSTMTSSSGSTNIECINKWCQPGSVPIYLLTDDFGTETKTASECAFVVFSVSDGSLSMGKTVTLRVDDKFDYNGSVAIPDGKLVLCLDKASGEKSCLDFVSRLSIGESVTVSSESVYDKNLWNSAQNGISSIGGRLIEKGVVNTQFAAGAAPRTAIGIKADGSIVFYAIDGRQKDYSYGLQLKTLARRMSEMGCVDAVNLDGGGSTAIGAVFGEGGFEVINKPSDGVLRACANYIFLKDNRKPTGIPGQITGNFRQNNNYLSGAMESFGEIGVVDTAGYNMNVENISYSIENDDTESTIDENHIVHLKGQGKTTVIISANGITKELPLYVYNTPDDILVYENGNTNEIKGYTFNTGDSFNIDLTADAYLNSAFLNGEDYNFTWSTSGGIGEVTNNGVFTLNSDNPVSGEIIVSAGDYSHSVPVTVVGAPILQKPFADISGHWAEKNINELRDKNIINGIIESGNLYFKPEQNVTRIQFAVMLCNMLGINSEDYAEQELDFADAQIFDEWMKNYAKAAYTLGFIKGREDNGAVYFDPVSEVTRAEAMVMLYRLKSTGETYEDASFADSGEIPEWARAAVNALYSMKVVNGYEDNTIKPDGKIKRAESATMLCKYIDK